MDELWDEIKDKFHLCLTCLPDYNNIVNNILLKVVVLDFIVLLFLVFSFMHVVNISEIFSKIRRGK